MLSEFMKEIVGGVFLAVLVLASFEQEGEEVKKQRLWGKWK